MIIQHDYPGFGGGVAADAADLLDVAGALEQDLGLAEGAVLRELTALLRRRRRFEGLKLHHGIRAHGRTRKWDD
jgi:hypothetical protein